MRPVTIVVGPGAAPGGSAPKQLDGFANGQIGIVVDVDGTAQWTIEVSNDDPNEPGATVTPATMTWAPAPNADLVTQSGIKAATLLAPFLWVRVNLLSGDGTVTAKFLQASIVPQ